MKNCLFLCAKHTFHTWSTWWLNSIFPFSRSNWCRMESTWIHQFSPYSVNIHHCVSPCHSSKINRTPDNIIRVNLIKTKQTSARTYRQEPVPRLNS